MPVNVMGHHRVECDNSIERVPFPEEEIRLSNSHKKRECKLSYEKEDPQE